MKEPIWISLEVALVFHEKQLEQNGGASGIRDRGMFESAMARPQNRFAYSEVDIFDLAAAYAYGIAMNHPFVDGNKRTAFTVCITFLAMNGFELTAGHSDRYNSMIGLVEGVLSEAEFADWLRDNTTPS